MSPPKNLRRSSRIKCVTKYTIDSDSESNSKSPANILKAEIQKQLEDIKEDVPKALELFSEKDISGRELYGFQTPVKNSMMLKAKQCRTPETPKSLKTLSDVRVVLERIIMSPENRKSHHNNDGNTKVSRKSFLPGMTSSGDESVSTGSEYVLTNDEDSFESDETFESEKSEYFDTSEEENNVRRITRERTQKSLPKSEIQDTPKAKKTNKGRKIVTYKENYIKTDEYFESQSEKVITSDRTLERLQNARFTGEKLNKLLVNQNHVSAIHKKHICSLIENYKIFFPMWEFIIEEGYSLLLHGLGSKRNLMYDFHNEIIKDHPALVINGFFPSLSLKDILNSIITDILDLDYPTNLNDCLELIEKVLRANPKDLLYLIVHNIDGIMLRSNKAQNILASLAAIPNIRVIASIDHINAPLLWDHRKRAKFNFYWWDVTTFLSYRVETSYESSLLVQQSGALALSSLQNVFFSLTSNARAIYIILVKYQLNNSSSNYAGMPFKDLYRAAREQFLVSSDLALRAQLTEFLDHKLVRTKRHVDGVEHLMIPLEKVFLKQFLEQHES